MQPSTFCFYYMEPNQHFPPHFSLFLESLCHCLTVLHQTEVMRTSSCVTKYKKCPFNRTLSAASSLWGSESSVSSGPVYVYSCALDKTNPAESFRKWVFTLPFPPELEQTAVESCSEHIIRLFLIATFPFESFGAFFHFWCFANKVDLCLRRHHNSTPVHCLPEHASSDLIIEWKTPSVTNQA